MKNLIAIALFLFVNTFAFAQDFDISEAPRAMNSGTYNSYLFDLPAVDEKTTEDQWKKFMKDFKGKSKYDKKSKLWTAEDVKIGRLSDSPLDVHARILEDKKSGNKTSVIVWFDLGEEFVDSGEDNLKGMYAMEILNEFATTTCKTQAQSTLKDQEKSLSSLEKDLKKLEKDNKNYYKEIEKAKKAIAENEKNIEVNEVDQKNKKKEIQAQAEAVTKAKAQVKKFN